jgi:hypothetical protein
LIFFFGAAIAQQPTADQRNAVKSACRSDFIAQCSGVSPGGIEALTCLQQHSATLSGSCRTAVSDISSAKPKSTSITPTATAPAAPMPAPQAHQPTDAQRSAVKSACRSDFMAQCAGVTPGGADALSCLQKHNASNSGACQQAVAALAGAAGSAPAAAPTTTAMPAPSPGVPMPSFSPREELFVIRETCGGDFRRFCRAVPLGGGRGIACLRENLPRLSAGCHKVLTTGL